MSPVEKFADDAFAVACEGILASSAAEQIHVLNQASRTGNREAHVAALAEVKKRQVWKMILARADAAAEASNLHDKRCDAKTEIAFERSAMQIAGGALAALRGQLQLMEMRTRRSLNISASYLETGIGAIKQSAANEGLLRLKRQRIIFQKAHGPSQPTGSAVVAGESGVPVAGASQGSREDRLQSFLRAHSSVTLADIRHSAAVHKPEFLDWRKEKLSSSSVMSQRIEDVLAGRRNLRKKLHKRQTD